MCRGRKDLSHVWRLSFFYFLFLTHNFPPSEKKTERKTAFLAFRVGLRDLRALLWYSKWQSAAAFSGCSNFIDPCRNGTASQEGSWRPRLVVGDAFTTANCTDVLLLDNSRSMGHVTEAIPLEPACEVGQVDHRLSRMWNNYLKIIVWQGGEIEKEFCWRSKGFIIRFIFFLLDPLLTNNPI